MTDHSRTPHLNPEFCTDLVHGLVSRAEAEVALKHASLCAQCEEMLRERIASFESSRALGLPVKTSNGTWVLPGLEHVAAAGSATAGDHLGEPRASDRSRSTAGASGWMRRLFSRPALAVATAAVLVLVALVLLPGANDTPPEYWIPAGREMVQPRSASPAATALRDGVRAYHAHQLDDAIASLQRADVEGASAQFRDIFLASALTMKQRYRDALTTLDRVSTNVIPEPWRSEAGWIRYLALYGDGQTDEAAQLLDELVDAPEPIGGLARARRSEVGNAGRSRD